MDTSKHTVRKRRICFIYDQQYFQLDTFTSIEGTPSILRMETTKESQQISIPPYVSVLKEVTEINEYETRFMAAHDYKMPEGDKKQIDQRLHDLQSQK
mmetsp:Transcript_37181/g.35832  ORF Transcript_37181/g.35832 Transcript_37181/m.35832 type:complete len:98 (-) Transcript_37181:11-304(-)